MVLVSEVLEHIGRINLANMKSQKLKFIRNTAPDNQRVLNFMRNPYILVHILVCYPWLYKYYSACVFMNAVFINARKASIN